MNLNQLNLSASKHFYKCTHSISREKLTLTKSAPKWPFWGEQKKQTFKKGSLSMDYD